MRGDRTRDAARAAAADVRRGICAWLVLARSEGKEGVYDKEVVAGGAVQPLIAMLLLNHVETRGFAAACLSCCCADDKARNLIAEHGGAEPLLALASSPSTWLRSQAIDMLKLLGIPFTDPDHINSPRHVPSPRQGSPKREPRETKPFIVGSKLIAQKTLPCGRTPRRCPISRLLARATPYRLSHDGVMSYVALTRQDTLGQGHRPGQGEPRRHGAQQGRAVLRA